VKRAFAGIALLSAVGLAASVVIDKTSGCITTGKIKLKQAD
jgi:hypothetical protein